MSQLPTVNRFGITVADAIAAFALARLLWRAVAANDIDGLRSLVAEPLRSQLADVSDLPARFGVTAEQANRIAASEKVRVLDDGSLLVLTTDTGGVPKILGVDGPELRHGWPIRSIKVAGTWRIVGLEEGDRQRIGSIDIPHDDARA